VRVGVLDVQAKEKDEPQELQLRMLSVLTVRVGVKEAA